MTLTSQPSALKLKSVTPIVIYVIRYANDWKDIFRFFGDRFDQLTSMVMNIPYHIRYLYPDLEVEILLDHHGNLHNISVISGIFSVTNMRDSARKVYGDYYTIEDGVQQCKNEREIKLVFEEILCLIGDITQLLPPLTSLVRDYIYSSPLKRNDQGKIFF